MTEFANKPFAVTWVVVTKDEVEALYKSMEGCCNSEGMDLIREILKRFDS